MKAILFDLFNGAGGDMIVASLLGISLKEDDLERVVKLLDLDISFKVKNVKVNGIAAKRLKVESESESESENETKENKRKYSEIVNLIKNSELEEDVKAKSIKIFERLAKAEGVIHGKDYKNAVFHEVGCDDAIFDVVCSTIGILRLSKEGYRFFSTPARLGSGFVECIHGKIPIPSPATLEILKNSKLKAVFDGEGELLTPTAAAILSEFVEGELKYPVNIRKISYSCGSRNTILRVVVCEVLINDCIFMLETNIDDVSGEILAHAVSRVMIDALDVSLIPALGKKGRPSYILRVLCKDDAEKMAEKIMRETGSAGVRVIPVYHRVKVPKKIDSIEIELNNRKFKVRVKNTGVNIKPEFEDVKKIADELNLPIIEVYRAIYNSLRV